MLKRLPPLIAVTTPVGQAFGFEHRPLLDVQFGVGQHLRRACARRRRSAQDRGRSRAARRASSMPFASVLVEQRRSRTCPRPRGCRAASSRSARPPRRRSRRPRWRTAGACRLACSAATHSIAEITPSMPSYLPASRTVSRCEPSMRHGSPGRVAFVAADAVADGVERAPPCRLRASSAAPAHSPRAALRRKEHARQSAFEFRQAAQRVAAIPDALRLQCGNERRVGGHAGCRSAMAAGRRDSNPARDDKIAALFEGAAMERNTLFAGRDRAGIGAGDGGMPGHAECGFARRERARLRSRQCGTAHRDRRIR